MKKALLLSLLVAAIGSTSFAQSQAVASQPASTESSAKLQTQQMSQDLGLTAEQTRTLFEVNKNISAKAVSIGAMADVKKANEAKEQIAKYQADQYQRILTKEQYQKWLSKTQGSRTSR